MKPPYNYMDVNYSESMVRPATIQISNSCLARYFRRYLLEEAIALFEYDLPESWDRDFFLYTLYACGYSAVFDTDKFGVINQFCTLSGYNVYYQPTRAIVSNPLIMGPVNARIGVDCTLVKLQPDYGSVMDIVNLYANMLALCAETAQINLLNSHVSYVFAAGNKNAAETFKKVYDAIASGNPACVVDKSLLSEDGRLDVQILEQNVGQNYIVSEILENMRTIRRMFLSEIGCPNNIDEKKERQIVAESTRNSWETRSKAQLWYDTIKTGFDKANAMFPGLNLRIRWRNEVITAMEGGDGNGNALRADVV